MRQYQIPCNNREDSVQKLKLITEYKGKLIGNNRDVEGVGTIVVEIESALLKKELRQKLGLFRVKITDINDQKLQELKEKFPTLTIEDDQEKSILVTGDIRLQDSLKIVVDSWNRTNPTTQAPTPSDAPETPQITPPVLEEKDPLKTKLQTFYQQNSNLPKLIDDEDIKEQSLKDCYTSLNIIIKDDKALEDLSQISDDNYHLLGDKKPITVDNILASQEEERKPIGKAIIIGRAGIGKTTLMHYIAYKWGEGHKSSYSRFDYLFQIRLRDLLNDEWRRNYNRDELNQYPLACFIHAHLGHDFRSEFKLEDIIKALSNQEKVLLLLDGYDEIAAKTTSDILIGDVLSQALKHQNIIMTSRPNVLSDKVSSSFERIIENAGLDDNGIESYIDLNFTGSDQLKSELKLFLSQNPEIKSMCSSPINAAILCLVWAKDEITNIKKISTDFNLNLLYEKIIILLGRRYIGKFCPDKVMDTQLMNIPDEQVIAIAIIKFLQDISYRAFSVGKTVISSELIKEQLAKDEYKELSIEAVNRYGLLKPETEGKKVIDDDHSFSHLTFLEYFTARQLISDLASLDQDIARKAANLIAANRNQARYLLVLKFMAGMVTAAKSDSASMLITRFWEAVTCNIDGIIDLEVEQKVILLMNLLAQAQVNGESDSRIPNINLIKKFIDKWVVANLANFSDKIIYSGYISKEILDKILSVINDAASAINDGKDVNIQEVKSALAILPTIANKHPEIRQDLIRKILLILKSDNWLLKKQVAEIISDLALTNIDSDLRNQLISDLILTIKNDYETKQNIDLIKSLITTLATISARFGLSVEALELIIFFATGKTAFDQIGYKAFIKAAGAVTIEELFKLIKPLLSSQGKWQVRHGVVFYLSQIAIIDPESADEVFLLLKPLTLDKEYKVRVAASYAIAKIVEINPKYTDQAFKILTPLISDQDLNVRIAAYTSIKEIAVADRKLAGEALLLLKSFLLCNKNSWQLLDIANSCSLELIDFIDPGEALRLVKTFLRRENDFEIRLGNLIKTLGMLKGITIDNVEPPIKRVICEEFNTPDIETLILILIEIKQTSGGTNHPEIRKKIVDAGGLDKLLTKISRKLVEDKFNLLRIYQSHSDKTSPLSNPALGSRDVDIDNLKQVAIKSVAKIAKIDPKISDRCIDIIAPLIDEGSGSHIKDAAKEAFCEIVKSASEAKAVEFLTSAFISTNHTFCDAGATALLEKIKSNPNFAKEASKLIMPILRSRITFNEHDASQAISEIAKAVTIDDSLEIIRSVVLQANYLLTGNNFRATAYLQEIVTAIPADRALKLVNSLLTINHPEIRRAASMMLPWIVNAKSQTQDLELIKLQLINQKPQEKEATIKNLLSLIKTNPKLATNILEIIEPHLADNTDYFRESSVPLLITEIIKLIPIDRTLEILRKLFAPSNNTLRKYNSGCSVHSADKVVFEYRELKTHMAALKQALETHPKLRSEALELVKSLTKEKKSEVRSNGAAIIYNMTIMGLMEPAQAIELIAPLLWDKKTDVKTNTATCLSEIVSFTPEVIGQIQELITPLYHDDNNHIEIIISKIIEQTAKTDPLATAQNLQKIIKLAPKIAVVVLRKTVPFYFDHEKDPEDSILVKIIKADHEIAIQAWDIIKPIFSSDYKTEWQSIDNAIEISSEIIKAAPELRAQMWQVVKPIIASHNWLGLRTSKQFIPLIINTTPEITSEALEILTQLPFETYQMSSGSIGDDYSPSDDAIKQVAKIVTANPELAIDTFNLYKTRLEKKGYERRAIIAMLSIVRINPNLIEEFITLVKPFTNHKDRDLRLISINLILELGKIAPNLITRLIEIAKCFFLNDDIDTRSLDQALEFAHSLTTASQELSGWINSASRDSDIKVALIQKMSELIDIDPILMAKNLNLIEPFLTFNAKYGNDTIAKGHLEQYTRNSAFYFFNKLAKVICEKKPDQIAIVAELLIHQNHQIRNNVIEILLEFLSNIENRRDLNQIQIIKIIATISCYNDNIAKQIGSNDQEAATQNAKKLLKLLPAILAKQISEIDNHSLKYLVENFDDLVTNPQIKICLKTLLHQLLKHQLTSSIDEMQAAFITKCAEHHFVSSFDGGSCQIIFDNQSYQLKAADDLLKFEDLAQIELSSKKTATGTDDQDLKKQYITHQPLFPNSQLTIKIAAYDIDRVLSLLAIGEPAVDSKNLLSGNSWQLSLMSRLDSQPFLLIQGRNIFGNIIIYKLCINHDQPVMTHIFHPLDINRKLREEVFGQIDYDQSEQLYYATTIAISGQQLAELLAKFRATRPRLAEIDEAEFRYLANIMLENDTHLSESQKIHLALPWDEYRAKDDTIKLSHIKLLADNSESDLAKQGQSLALAFRNACYNGNLQLVKDLILTNPEIINSQDKDGNTGLHLACYNSHKEIVEFLLSLSDINYDTRNNDGFTCLLIASQKGYMAIVDLLLKKGANTEIADLFNKKPIDLVGARNQEIFELLKYQEGFNFVKDKIINETFQNILSQKSLIDKITFNPVKIEALNKSHNQATNKLELEIKVTFSYKTKKGASVTCEITKNFSIGSNLEGLKDDSLTLEGIDRTISEIVDDALEIIAPQLQEKSKTPSDRLSHHKIAAEITQLKSDILDQISKLDQRFEQIKSEQGTIEIVQEKVAHLLSTTIHDSWDQDNLRTTLSLYLETLREVYNDHAKTIEEKARQIAKKLPSYRSLLKSAIRDEERKLSKYHHIREKKLGQSAEESAKRDSVIESRINQIKLLLSELEPLILEQQKIIFKQIQASYELDKKDAAITKEKRQALATKLSDLRNAENILSYLLTPIISKPSTQTKLPQAQGLESVLYLPKTKISTDDLNKILSPSNFLKYSDEQLVKINSLLCNIDDETEKKIISQQFVDTASTTLISSANFTECARRIEILMTKVISKDQQQQIVENICNSYNQIVNDNLVTPAKFIEGTKLLLTTINPGESTTDNQETTSWTKTVGQKQTKEKTIIKEFMDKITNQGDFIAILVNKNHSKHSLSDPTITGKTISKIISENIVTSHSELKEIFGDQFLLTDETVKNIIEIINETYGDNSERRNRGAHCYCVLIPKIFPNPKSTLSPQEKEKYLKKFKDLAAQIQKSKELTIS